MCLSFGSQEKESIDVTEYNVIANENGSSESEIFGPETAAHMGFI